MKFTIQAKLLTLVWTTALSFIVLVLASAYLVNRMENQLAKVREHYIPIIEVGPRLETAFEHMRRGYQDSVAAQDLDSLEKVDLLKQGFASTLSDVANVLDSSQVSELRQGLDSYSISARDVSSRLIRGETGENIGHSIEEMQEKQSRVELLLKKVTTLDRRKVGEAFAIISRTQETNGRIQIFISVICLIIMTFMSLGLSHNILRSIASLSSGLSRFGQGDFNQDIVISGADELADVASQANQMANRIQELLKELESFSYAVAHDLRAPLRSILGFSGVLLEDCGPELSSSGRATLERVMASSRKMSILIDSLLGLAQLARKEIEKEEVNLSDIVIEIVEDLRRSHPDRVVILEVEKEVVVEGDYQLLKIVLTNLVGNAWKFTAKTSEGKIQFGVQTHANGKIYFIRDNGAGFDMQYAGRLFGTFQRLHSSEEFEGTGIGLTTVQRIIRRHKGKIWAEASPNHGATFFFELWKNSFA